MNVETNMEQSGEKESSLPFPKAWWGRLLYGIYIIGLPIFSFWATNAIKPTWQSGELSAYIVLFLLPEASLMFFLLLAYSIVCYLLLLSSPVRFSKSFEVRCGIYTGILLALQYSILILLYSLGSLMYVLLLVWTLPVVFLLLYRWIITRWTARKVYVVLLIFILPVALIIVWLARLYDLLFVVIAGVLMSGPFWSFLLAVRASIWLIKNYETRISLPRGLQLTTWLAAYIVAWRLDILRMYDLYAALPPAPPNCYIATAAARGHPQVVHAWTVHRADGRTLRINSQLQLLKCAELALLAVSPSLHRLLRGNYDRIGKALAHYIQNPLLADIAYVVLKPWEWMAGFALRLIIPEIDSISKRMYMNG